MVLLCAADNKIESVQGLVTDEPMVLTTLELRGNALTTIEGLALPTLKKLYLVRHPPGSLE